eukprot:TRINITY_DN7708_c0_g1_i1.p1 TRINITY_DN7708_c0_g1~~TRINITY_DN7708_c0_g1_i1.p1  ORF type:complete len:574 (+),score=160.83 TRINITY_DN7708_c0_g1_i1:55-1776(+)
MGVGESRSAIETRRIGDVAEVFRREYLKRFFPRLYDERAFRDTEDVFDQAIENVLAIKRDLKDGKGLEETCYHFVEPTKEEFKASVLRDLQVVFKDNPQLLLELAENVQAAIKGSQAAMLHEDVDQPSEENHPVEEERPIDDMGHSAFFGSVQSQVLRTAPRTEEPPRATDVTEGLLTAESKQTERPPKVEENHLEVNVLPFTPASQSKTAPPVEDRESDEEQRAQAKERLENPQNFDSAAPFHASPIPASPSRHENAEEYPHDGSFKLNEESGPPTHVISSRNLSIEVDDSRRTEERKLDEGSPRDSQQSSGRRALTVAERVRAKCENTSIEVEPLPPHPVVVQTPIAQTPIVQTPIVQTPIAPTPIVQAPKANIPEDRLLSLKSKFLKGTTLRLNHPTDVEEARLLCSEESVRTSIREVVFAFWTISVEGSTWNQVSELITMLSDQMKVLTVNLNDTKVQDEIMSTVMWNLPSCEKLEALTLNLRKSTVQDKFLLLLASHLKKLQGLTKLVLMLNGNMNISTDGLSYLRGAIASRPPTFMLDLSCDQLADAGSVFAGCECKLRINNKDIKA